MQTQAKYGADGTLSFIKPGLGLGGVNNMWADCPLLEWQHDPTIGFHWFDHFESYITLHKGLTSHLVADGGTATCTAPHSLALNTVDATDNDEITIGSSVAHFSVASGRDIWYETRVKITEAAAASANILVGLSSLVSANLIQDTAAGPSDDYCGIVLFKADTGTVWQCETAEDVGATETTITSAGAFVSGTWVRLGFRVTSNTMVTFYINGVAVGGITTTLPLSPMYLVWALKNGTAAAEILYVDWFRFFQLA